MHDLALEPWSGVSQCKGYSHRWTWGQVISGPEHASGIVKSLATGPEMIGRSYYPNGQDLGSSMLEMALECPAREICLP